MSLENVITLDVDIKKLNYFIEPTVTANDRTIFVINLKDNDFPINLVDVSTITLVSKRLDGRSVITPGVKGLVVGHQVVFELGKSETAVNGRVSATVQLYDYAGRISSIAFGYIVKNDPSASYLLNVGEITLIQIVLEEGPLRIKEATDAAIAANEAVDNIEAKIIEYDEFEQSKEAEFQAFQDEKNAEIQVVLDETRFIEDYNQGVAYKRNNIVSFNGSSYIARQDTIGNPPPALPQTTNAFWGLAGRKGADGTGTVVRHRDEFIATAGQTVFTLSNTYDQSQNRIDAEVGGVPQFSPDNFTETSSTSVTFTEGIPIGTKVMFTYFSEAQPLGVDLETTVNSHTTNLNTNNDLLNAHTALLAEKAKQTSGGDLNAVWIPPTQPARSEIINTNSPTTFLNNTFEVLRSNYPDYISRTNLGLDATGVYPFYKYVFEPKHYEKTIILGAGIHGSESSGIQLLYKFMKHVCEDYTEYPQLNYAREKVRFIVLPIQSPYGFFYSQRYNGNNVDINRNFDYKWSNYAGTDKGTAPLSEAETQYIDAVLEEYKEAVGYIDIHNTGAMEGVDYYCAVPRWGYNNNVDLLSIMKAVSPQPVYRPLLDYVIEPVSVNHAMFSKGLNAISAEMVDGAFGVAPTSSEDMTNGMAFVGNIILNMIGKSPLKEIELKEHKAIALASNANTFTTTSASFVEIPFLTFTFVPKSGGTLIVTGSVTTLNTSAVNSSYIAAVVVQTGSPMITEATQATQQGFFDVFGRGERLTLPFNRTVPILPKSVGKYGDVTLKLFAKVDGGSTLQHLRTRINILFIPSNNSSYEYWTSNGSGVLEKIMPN